MIQLLVKIAHKLNISYEDLNKLDSTFLYKNLLKQLRKLLSKTHPDSGGNADDFNEVHILYEELLALSKKDINSVKIKEALTVLISNTSQLNNKQLEEEAFLEFLKNKCVSDSYSEFINDYAPIEVPRNKVFHVDIAELVLHFNTLKYCTLTQFNKNGPGRVFVNFKFISHINNATETADLQLWADYTQHGKYVFHTTLSCSEGEQIEVQTLGFDKSYIFEVSNVALIKATFKQNNVEVVLQIRVYATK